MEHEDGSKICTPHQIKENEMGRTCSMHVGEIICVQNYGWNV